MATEKERLDALVKATAKALEIPQPTPPRPEDTMAATITEAAKRAQLRYPPRR
jgi:hypothetical protein